MKTNVCVLKKGNAQLANILVEAEKIAQYNELNAKNSLRLRLLAEEMTSLLNELVSRFDGEFYIENDGNKYELRATLSVGHMSIELKEELIALATSKKNSAAKGILGKIRNAIDTMILNMEGVDGIVPLDAMDAAVPSSYYSYKWSLDSYKESNQKKDEAAEELQRSIIANLADNVIVGVKGSNVEITIVKSF